MDWRVRYIPLRIKAIAAIAMMAVGKVRVSNWKIRINRSAATAKTSTTLIRKAVETGLMTSSALTWSSEAGVS